MLFLFTFTVLSVVNALGIPISYGSTIKLMNRETSMLLHSHQIGWGSGSGQQSVTCSSGTSDQGDLWTLLNSVDQPFQDVGTPVKCGDKVKLTHISTNKNLHSHLFKAALTGNQEVSCFGEGGLGDTGDTWVVECAGKEQHWGRNDYVSLKHQDTGKYLFSSKVAEFNQQNCGMQCPIMSQTEVSASHRKEGFRTSWIATQGVFFPPKGYSNDVDDEL